MWRYRIYSATGYFSLNAVVVLNSRCFCPKWNTVYARYVLFNLHFGTVSAILYLQHLPCILNKTHPVYFGFSTEIVQLKVLDSVSGCLEVIHTKEDCEKGDRVPCGAQARGESSRTQRSFSPPSVFISHLPVPSPLPRRDINLHQQKTRDNISHETSTNTITHIMPLCIKNMEPFRCPYAYS